MEVAEAGALRKVFVAEFPTGERRALKGPPLMSCDVAASAAILLATLTAPIGGPGANPSAARQPPTPTAWMRTMAVSLSVNPLAQEPLYADIVRRAERLRRETEAYRAGLKSSPVLADPEGFATDIAALSALDLQGHLDLAKRGTDGDLKCILKGISQDLPRKLAELQQAKDPAAKDAALEDMVYLLRDNVEVITTPPTVQSGT